MSSRSHRWFGAIVAVCLVASCAQLSEIETNRCGNGVVEIGEDCDGLAARLPTQGAGAVSAGRDGGATTSCGAQGSPNQCRYGCTTSDDCPKGWGCNLNDNVCAAPTGTFSPGLVDKNGAVRLVAGDFDGDGRKDLVLSQPSGLDGNALASAYFYTTGMRIRERVALPISLGATSVIPSATTTAAVANASDAGTQTGTDAGASGGTFPLSDLTFASAFGLGILRGSADRPFVPELFPYLSLSFGQNQKASQIVAIPKPPRDGSLRGQVGYYLTVTVAAQTALVPFELNGAPRFDTSLVVPGKAEEVRFIVPPGGEALCFRGDGCAQALVWSRSEPGRELVLVDAPPDPPRQAPRFQVEGGIDAVGLGDIDGDGIYDVVIGPRVKGDNPPKEAFCPYVIYGSKIRANPQAAPVERLTAGCVTEPFVGLVDLNGDGLADFVYGSSIQLSARAEGGALVGRNEAYRRSSSAWTQLEVGDFDGDGKVDAILAVQGQSGLDVLRGGSGEIRPLSVPTPEPVDVITSGYFDADRMIDVAYTTKLVKDESREASAYVVFGGPENQTTPVGTKNVSQLVNLRRPIGEKFLPDTDFIGLVQDTAVVQKGGRVPTPMQGAPSQATLFTAYVPQGRAAVSILRRTRNDTAIAGRAQAFGSFTGPGALDAVQIALSEKANCAQGATVQTVEGVLTAPTLTEFGAIGSLPVAYGPQLPIALVAGKTTKTAVTDDTFFLTVRDGQLVVSRAARRPPAFAVELAEIYRTPYAPTAGPCPVPDPRDDALFPQEKLALVDVDDDGFLDLVFSDGGRLPLTGQPNGQPGLMFVLRNDQAGGFVPLNAAGLVGRSFAMVSLGERGKALAVLEPERIALYQVTGGALARVGEAASFVGVRKDAARAIEAGDFDGDGIDDLAVLSAGTLQIFRGQARVAGSASDGGAE